MIDHVRPYYSIVPLVVVLLESLVQFCKQAQPLLIVSKEDSDWQPAILTDLETLCDGINLLYLCVCKLPAIQLKIALDSLLRDAFGNHAPALLQPPHEQDLLWRFPFGFSYLQ